MKHTKGSSSAALALLAAVSMTLGPGCALFTDLDTRGYQEADAGAGEGGLACTGDANCAAESLSCVSVANCPSAQVCCLTPTSTTLSAVNIACQPTASCGLANLSVQLCASSAECDNGDPCTKQKCVLAGTATSLSACTLIPTCAAE